MAILILEPFEYVNSNTLLRRFWDTASSWGSLVTPGRFGGNAASLGVGVNIQKTFPSILTVTYQGIARKEGFNTTDVLIMTESGGLKASVQHIGDGRMQFHILGSTKIIPGVIVHVDRWYYHEMYCATSWNPSPSPGVLAVSCTYRIDGFQISSHSASTSTAVKGFDITRIQGGAGAIADDYYLVNSSGPYAPHNTFLGDVGLNLLKPGGDGNWLQFTPDTGSVHFSRVNEQFTDDDSSYVATSTDGHRDSYTFDDIGKANIKAVQQVMSVRTAGTPIVFNGLYRQSGTTIEGTDDFLCTADYLYYHKVWPVNPVTGIAWTQSDVDGGEWGIRRNA